MKKERIPPTISYYKSDKGVFWKISGQLWILNIGNYLLNGKDMVKSNGGGDWFFLEGEKEIKKLSEKVHTKREVVGFKIKNEDLASASIPKYIPKEEVGARYSDALEDYIWEKYNDIRSLYIEDIKIEPETFKSIDFKINHLGDIKVENIEAPKDMTYKVYRDGTYRHKGDKQLDLSRVAMWSDIDEMLIPEFALFDRPCSITSKQTFDIVRHHVNENIDPKEAVVTSNYDFCFTVKKKIHIKPYIRKTEILTSRGKSYSRPRFTEGKITHRQEDIFEMTHEKKGYQNYTIIKGFKGDTIKDLAENVKLFLDELMEHINSPVEECGCCKGTGHILPKKKHANKELTS